MTREQPSRIHGKRESPALIVAWSYDAGRVAPRVIEFLDKKLDFEGFGEIEPVGFFSLDGVRIEDDLICFPESRFYSSSSARNIIILNSDAPSREHYKFLNAVLDFAQDHFKVKELYTIGGIVSASTHLSPRRVFAVVNRRELKGELAPYGVEVNVDYQTPPGSMPTLSSFLIWVARRKGIAGCGLWINVPFYLSAVGDPTASKYILEVLDARFELGLDFRELDLEIEKLNEDVEQLMRQDPNISRYIQMLERGIALSESEREKLAQDVAGFVRGSRQER